jgi:hypothetical protein
MRPGDREVSTDDAPNLDWREQAWLLKNSLSKKQQKLDRVRMPYKRFVGAA